MDKNGKFIDLDNILKTRSPKYYKFLPKFLINKLKKIIHEDDINYFMSLYKNYEGQDFVSRIVDFWNIRIKYFGIDKIKNNNKYVIASNHPLGGLDGISILSLVYKFLGEVNAVVNDLLLQINNLKPVLTGVNVFGNFTKKQIIELDELYKSDKHIIVFPSGVVSRKTKGVIKDPEWKKSFLTKAITNNRSIIPVYTEAKNSNFFYNISNIRKFLGFKFSYELIYLPDEMYKFKNQEIIFKFGEPIPAEFFTPDKSINYWVEYIRAKSDELKNLPVENFNEYKPELN